MKTYLLPENGKFYKANLHSHSNCSDGKLTVQEMKEEYKKRGYSILATSDHDLLRGHYELSDPDFLLITAYEISIRSDDDPTPHTFRKVVDLNLFAKDPYQNVQVGYHPETVEWLVRRGKMTEAELKDVKYAGELRDMHYYPANINRIIREANKQGYLVSINHPMWSLTNYSDYGCYEGAWAVEVYNYGCHILSGMSDSEAVFEDILRSGKQIFAIATDDNHNTHPLDSPLCDSFGGFTMIKSVSLEYGDVMDALEKGHFYASTGPEINELYYEDGYVHITCSPVQDICMLTLGRRGKRAAGENGELITGASFKIKPDSCGYVRFRLTDSTGKKAYTNAYYADSFEKESVSKRVIL